MLFKPISIPDEVTEFYIWIILFKRFIGTRILWARIWITNGIVSLFSVQIFYWHRFGIFLTDDVHSQVIRYGSMFNQQSVINFQFDLSNIAPQTESNICFVSIFIGLVWSIFPQFLFVYSLSFLFFQFTVVLTTSLIVYMFFNRMSRDRRLFREYEQITKLLDINQLLCGFDR